MTLLQYPYTEFIISLQVINVTNMLHSHSNYHSLKMGILLEKTELVKRVDRFHRTAYHMYENVAGLHQYLIRL